MNLWTYKLIFVFRFLDDNILVKGNKPRWLYANPDVVYNLKDLDAKEFADLLKINLGNKWLDTAFDVINSGRVNVKTVQSYRAYLMENELEKYDKYLRGPTIIWDQIK